MKEILQDYRCECGKLLLRGLIFTGGIEVKCKYCKKIQTINGLTGELLTNTRYIMFVDENGVIVNTSSSISKHLGFSSAELLGTYVVDYFMMLEPNFYAVLWETLAEEKTDTLFYTLQKNKDKSLVPVTIDAKRFRIKDADYGVFTVEKKFSKKLFGPGGVTLADRGGLEVVTMKRESHSEKSDGPAPGL
jgi:PAS domain S-box-containing protein